MPFLQKKNSFSNIQTFKHSQLRNRLYSFKIIFLFLFHRNFKTIYIYSWQIFQARYIKMYHRRDEYVWILENSFIEWKLLLYKIRSNGRTLSNNLFDVDLMQQFKERSYIIKISNYDI